MARSKCRIPECCVRIRPFWKPATSRRLNGAPASPPPLPLSGFGESKIYPDLPGEGSVFLKSFRNPGSQSLRCVPDSIPQLFIAHRVKIQALAPRNTFCHRSLTPPLSGFARPALATKWSILSTLPPSETKCNKCNFSIFDNEYLVN